MLALWGFTPPSVLDAVDDMSSTMLLTCFHFLCRSGDFCWFCINPIEGWNFCGEWFICDMLRLQAHCCYYYHRFFFGSSESRHHEKPRALEMTSSELSNTWPLGTKQRTGWPSKWPLAKVIFTWPTSLGPRDMGGWEAGAIHGVF